MCEYRVTAKEESISCHGLNFLCIYGRHINGGYVAIVNWGVAAELSVGNDITYDRNKILAALERSDDIAWLPSDPEARSAIARDLAVMIGNRIASAVKDVATERKGSVSDKTATPRVRYKRGRS